MQIAFTEHHRYETPLRVGSHQLATELLARGHSAMWLPHARSLLHRLRGEMPRASQVLHPDGMLEVTLRSLAPYVNLPLLRSAWWGQRWLQAGVDNRSRLQEAGLHHVDILWISDFTMLPLIDLVPADRVVLRFFDLLTEFRWMPRSIFELVRRYLPRLDLVLASSRLIREELANEGIEAVYLPNGANTRGLRPLLPETGRRDRVVYLGALEDWFDLETVELWARHLHELEFIVVGPNPHGFDSILDNLHFIGPRPYDQALRILEGARFGIIPFHRNRLTEGIHPLKLYDYLVAGCPVLSAALPEVEPRPEGVLVYRDAAEGLAILEEHFHRPFDRQALRELAIVNGWPVRLERIGEHLGVDLGQQERPE